MSHNTLGRLFRVTTWGESHGIAIGCVIDGCPPGVPLQEGAIQALLDRRRPGRSRFTGQPAWSGLETVIEQARRTQTAYLTTSAGPASAPAGVAQRDKP